MLQAMKPNGLANGMATHSQHAEREIGAEALKRGLAKMLKGGVILCPAEKVPPLASWPCVGA